MSTFPEEDFLGDDEGDEGNTKESRAQPKYETTERVFRLLRLLSINECTLREIFERLQDFYHISDEELFSAKALPERTRKMFLRDVRFLRTMGYTIHTIRESNAPARYRADKNSGPETVFLFNQSELDALSLLYTLFADPTKHTQIAAKQASLTRSADLSEAASPEPLPEPSPRSPFAINILALIDHLTAALPEPQKRYFDQWSKKPYIYFNMDLATDYLPHRSTIDTIVKAISHRCQIRFDYTALYRDSPIPHGPVDPYYIIQQDGHLYLISYNHQKNDYTEYRIDRIIPKSVKETSGTINSDYRRRPIEFRYWVYGNMAKKPQSLRWLKQAIEREEVYVEQGKTKRKVLVRAQAYSDWRILQQLQRYGDQVELVSPPYLRQRMKQQAERIAGYYQEK